VFLEERVTVPLPLTDAVGAFERLLTDATVDACCGHAYGHGVDMLTRVGPVSWLSKRVQVRWLPPKHTDGHVTYPLRWEATGPADALFPALDADIGLTSVDASTTQVTVIGSYRPPLGEFGRRVDLAVMRRAARATMRTLLHRLANEMQQPARSASAQSVPHAEMRRVRPYPAETV
jgi:hypothetical protein